MPRRAAPQAKGTELIMALPSKLPRLLLGDPAGCARCSEPRRQRDQVTQGGEVVVSAGLPGDEKAIPHCPRFEVRDTGVGIATAVQAEICSKPSRRPTARRPVATVAPAWVWRSPSSS